MLVSDAVSFDSYVIGTVGATAVASISLWILGSVGSRFGCLGIPWGSPGLPERVHGGCLWIPFRSISGPFSAHFLQGQFPGHFWEILGRLLEPFWEDFGHILGSKIHLENSLFS